MDELTVDDIIAWIIANRDEQEAIDEINSVTFPFTSKYKGFSEQKPRCNWKQADDISGEDDDF